MAPIGVFLAKRIRVFIQRHLFVYRLKLIHAPVFLFPFAFGIEQPVLDARVTQLQPLGEEVVIGIACAVGRFSHSVVKSALADW